MNQVLVGGIALIIAFILWGSKKQSKGSPFLKTQKDYIPNSNERISFVQTNQLINQKEPNKKLTKLFSSNPDDRLLAIQIASQWENKQSIPFLRRGLKDSDSRVVIASAAAIASYKGKTINLPKKSQASRPPRNVSLMR